MLLAGQCCLNWLDRDFHFLPTGGWEVAHDVGRWWDAVLRLEASTDFEIPSELEAAMLHNLQRMTDNPDGLLLNSQEFEGLIVQITLHNLREAMIAFHALVRYRESEWAREAARRLLETLDRCLRPDGALDVERLACWGQIPMRVPKRGTADVGAGIPAQDGWFDSTETTGRCLEGIVWYYQATGDPLAIQVAERIAAHHLENSTSPDGSVRSEILEPTNIGHCHSYLGTLRGLLLFGLETGQREYVDRVAATYHVGIPKSIMSESGWTPHDLGMVRYPDDNGDPFAEPASCGDALQIALWLALHDDQPRLFDDVERLMRTRILPCQIVSEDQEFPGERTPSSLPKLVGGWGPYSPPYSRGGVILDILAAVLHTELDAYDHIVERNENGLRVNLHFDYDGPECSLSVARSGTASVRCRPKHEGDLQLRLPGWAPEQSVTVTVDGEACEWSERDPYVLISRTQLPPGAEARLSFELPERTTVETMPVSGHEYTLSWRGDRPVSVIPYDDPCRLYA